MVATIEGIRQLSMEKTGTAGTIARITSDLLAGRLLAMGILPGSQIRLIRRAPFGGGWYVEVDKHFLALRKQEAACIILR